MINFKPNAKKTRYIKINNNDWKPYIKTSVECPNCKMDNIKKMSGKWIGKCPSCHHIHSFFYPIPFQAVALQLRAKIINLFGGVGCVDKETQYFNGKEWINISDYKDGDKVLQYNEDGSAVLVKPSKYHKYEANGWIDYKNKYLDMRLSKEHNIYSLNKSNNLVKTNALEFANNHNKTKYGSIHKIPQSFIYKNNNKNDFKDDELKLMVAIAADGTLEKLGKVVAFNLKKQYKIDRLKKITETLNIKCNFNYYPKTGYTRTNMRFRYITKFISDWVYKLNQHQLQIVAKELVKWDGSEKYGRNGNGKIYRTTWKREAEASQFVFSAVGHKSKLSKVEDGRIYKISKDYAYNVGFNEKSSTSLNSKKINKFEFKDSKKGEYKYCFTVPSGMLILKRNDKIFITGNSGKTSVSSSIISETMRMKPGVEIIAFAQTEDQLKLTGKAELIKFFTKEDFKTFNKDEWILKNGSKISWYTSGSEQKIRGANVGIAWLIESSGIKKEIFDQLTNRTRHEALKVYELDENGEIIFNKTKDGNFEGKIKIDYGMLLNETNPTFNWPREHGLFRSHTILYTKNVRGLNKIRKYVKPAQDPEDKDMQLDMISFLVATVDNPMMTKEFMSTIRTTYNDVDDYNRDLYCDMSFTSGLVYSEGTEDIPTSTKPIYIDGQKTYTVESMDPGGASKGNDESAYGYFIIKESANKFELPDVYLVDGYKISGLHTSEEAAEIWKVRNRNNYRPENARWFAVDPHGIKNEKKTGSNLLTDLRDYGIFMSKDGVSDDVDYGIKKMNMFIKTGKFHVTNQELWEKIKKEMSTYVWTNKTSTTRNGNKVVKPSDKNNHLLDMIRFSMSKIAITPEAQKMAYSQSGIIAGPKKSYNASSLNPYNYQGAKVEEEFSDLDGEGNIYFEL